MAAGILNPFYVDSYKYDNLTGAKFGTGTEVKVLNLHNSSVEMVEDLRNLKETLLELEISNCKKIKDYDSLKYLTNLKKLIITDSGEIKSL